MAEPVCVISGVGPGTGTALVRRFAAGGCRIAMLARTAERLADLAAEMPSAKAFVCDVSDQTQVDAALDLVEREMGAPSVLIHNAVGGAWGTFMEVDPATLNRNFQVNTMGLLYLARRLAPTMVTAMLPWGRPFMLRQVGSMVQPGCRAAARHAASAFVRWSRR
jgi:NAD(P)-dependent dehydrogenase (short-subunit alcohol dehydrogenase family)